MDVREAEQEIATILQRLEVETGRVVCGIFVLATEARSIGGDALPVPRRVHVDLSNAPGQGWEVGRG